MLSHVKNVRPQLREYYATAASAAQTPPVRHAPVRGPYGLWLVGAQWELRTDSSVLQSGVRGKEAHIAQFRHRLKTHFNEETNRPMWLSFLDMFEPEALENFLGDTYTEGDFDTDLFERSSSELSISTPIPSLCRTRRSTTRWISWSTRPAGS